MGGRRQFIGRHLMMKGEYVEMLLSGRKKATIRLGVVRPKYREVIIHGYGRPLAKARITSVEVKRVKDLTVEDAWLDGFNSLGELLRALRRAYGSFDPEDPVTIIKLEVTKRMDQLDPGEPYMGLEPGDVARLALRYLKDEVGEEERRVLRVLTSTNSIRQAAVTLYGSLDKRWRVRRILRRMIRLLVERGVVGSSGVSKGQ